MYDFDTAYREHHAGIARDSRSQWVPGLDPDDVENEMLTCLWKACQTWNERHGPLRSYFWSIWLNRKSDLLGKHFATKRIKALLTDEPPEQEAPADPTLPEPPTGASTQERVIWAMLAVGEPVKDVLEMSGASRRFYYRLLKNWRDSEEVRNTLSN